jgi:sec-independent protein translocase protein TatB
MFNLSGSEIVFLLLLALIVLGPEKLPEAVRKFGKAYAEFKKMSTGFQSELKTALDEPMKEMRETAEAFKKAVNFDFENGDTEDGQPAVVDNEAGRSSPEVAEPAEPAEAAEPVEPVSSAAPTKPEVVEAVEEPASE